MKKRHLVSIVSAIMMCVLTPAVLAQKVEDQNFSSSLIFAGSGSNLAITRLLATAFMQRHPGIRIEVPGSIGSKGGIKAVADGAIDAGLVSRPLNEKEKELGLTVLPYARIAVVIGVNPTVSEDDITFEDLVDIYKGTKSSWQDGREIIVLTREPGDSSILALVREIPGFREAYDESRQARRWTTLFTDQRMNQVLAKTPFAIGISDMGAIVTEQLGIKVLKLNGVMPTVDNIRDGRYSLVKELAFVYTKNKLSEGARTFLDFVHSDAGAKILQANGCMPPE